MKPLILSFFLVILGFSLFTNNEKEGTKQIPVKEQRSVYYETQQDAFQHVDSLILIKDKTAFLK